MIGEVQYRIAQITVVALLVTTTIVLSPFLLYAEWRDK